jgi:hypothetical protein
MLSSRRQQTFLAAPHASHVLQSIRWQININLERLGGELLQRIAYIDLESTQQNYLY